MAKTSKLVSTGRDETKVGENMSVEAVALYGEKHVLIGYVPMIFCDNEYGRRTMITPGLIELTNYYKGIEADWMTENGMDTREGAVATWESCPVAAEDLVPSAVPSYTLGLIKAGGFMRTLEGRNAAAAETPEPDHEAMQDETADPYDMSEYEVEL